MNNSGAYTRVRIHSKKKEFILLDENKYSPLFEQITGLQHNTPVLHLHIQ